MSVIKKNKTFTYINVMGIHRRSTKKCLSMFCDCNKKDCFNPVQNDNEKWICKNLKEMTCFEYLTKD